MKLPEARTDTTYKKQRKLLIIFLIIIGFAEMAGALALIKQVINRDGFLLGNFFAAALIVGLIISFLFDFCEVPEKQDS